MMGVLLGNAETVQKCIKFREEEAYRETNRYFKDKFTDPRNNLEKEAEKLQNDEIRKWTEGEKTFSPSPIYFL